MTAKHLVAIGCISLLAVGSWLISTNGQLFTTDQFDHDATIEEPDIAAARNRHNQILLTRKEPLNFGALVGGHANRYIELSPDGDVHTSGPIVDQSNHTYIGNVNSRQFANHHGQIQPGRLSFKIPSSERHQYIQLKFLPGELISGVALSRLNFRMGPDTHGVRLIKNHHRPNVIMFQVIDGGRHGCLLCFGASRSSSQVNIDLLYGGRLTVSNHSHGDIRARMNVKVTVGKDSKFQYQ